MSDENDIKLAEINTNLTHIKESLSKIEAWIVPIQTHVTQVQTGIKLAKWLCGGGVITGFIAFIVKMAGHP